MMLKNILKKFFLIVLLIININIFADEKDELIYNLYNQLEKTNNTLIEMTIYAETLENNNELLIIQIENNIAKLKEFQKQIINDQKEISNLREALKIALNNQEKFYRIGLGISYPLGGQIVFGLTIPKLPIGFYTSLGISTPPILNSTMTINIFVTGGILIKF